MYISCPYRIISMNVLHVSPIYNRSSILKYGLIPSKVKLSSHLKIFKSLDLVTENDESVYTFEDCLSNEKFIKDMIYCYTYLHARNKIQYETDFSKLYNLDLFGYDKMIFDVYLSEDLNEYEDNGFIHEQTPSDSKYNTAYRMSDEYSHTDKILRIYKNKLSVKLIGSTMYEKLKNNNFNIKILKRSYI